MAHTVRVGSLLIVLALAITFAMFSGAAPQGSKAAHGPGATSGLIAYARSTKGGGPSDVFLMKPDGTGQRRLARGDCFDWSPDGRRIAFFADGVYVIDIDGTGLRQLLTASQLTFDPPWWEENKRWRVAYCEDVGLDWSPNGRSIAVGGLRGIVIVKSDGTRVSQLTSGDDSLPRWSPDGRTVAFERDPDVGKGGSEVLRVNTDGSQLLRLTYDTRRDYVADPRNISWSPDGRAIAYENGDDIYVMGADGSQQRNLTRTPYGGADDNGPSWSPDGTVILFETSGSIHSLTLAGHRHRNLTRGDRGTDGEPSWSPDGRYIVFARATRYQWDLYKMTAAGEAVVNLTNTARPIFDRKPSWSP